MLQQVCEGKQNDPLWQQAGITEQDAERYREMLEYVEQCLQLPRNSSVGKTSIDYKRFEHTKRVTSWAIRLYLSCDEKERARVNLDSLMVATIFHDSGYNSCQDMADHGNEGARIAAEYLESVGYERDQIVEICDLIAHHSRKDLLKSGDISGSLVILMEADWLDDMGAMGIVMDTWIQAASNPEVSFASIKGHIERYTLRQQYKNRDVLRSKAALRFWDEKTAITQAFFDQLCRDLEDPL